MKKYLKWIGLSLLAILVLLQIFQIEKTNPKAKPEDDFLSIHKTEAKTPSLIKSACYDCHSYETKYPWYTYVVPISLWIKKHIDNGRKELNFSTWASYNPKKADHKIEESAEMVSEKKMPLKSYVLAHSEAKLSPEEIKLLSDYFNSLRSSKEDKSKDNHEDDKEDND